MIKKNGDLYKNNKVNKVILVIVLLLIIFNKLIWHLIDKYFINKKKYDNLNNIKRDKINKKTKTMNNENDNIENFENNSNEIIKMTNLNDNTISKIFKDDINISNNKLNVNPTTNIFKDNTFNPMCCINNNQYSSSNGCPCITSEQEFYLQNRGLNKTESMYNNIKNPGYKNIFFSPSKQFKNM
tara:strand:+ start:42 stop:593 length:552 start_codon:yes stop_codon:yes gene_type:complete